MKNPFSLLGGMRFFDYAQNDNLRRMTALQYAPNGVRYVLTNAICPNGRDMFKRTRYAPNGA